MHTEMVWAHNKINRTCIDDPTGHGSRTEIEKQTGKETGRYKNIRTDRIRVG